jgi:sirohydrochlorin ferrochelatase
MAEPTIAQGVARLVEQGVRQITVQPLLLFAAEHARRDIPEQVAKAAESFPGLQWHQTPHLGCHLRLLELSELRYREAIATRAGVPDDQTLLLMVGRGSRDPQANSEMASFSRLRWEQRRLGRVETCYLAMTRPTLAEGLASAARHGLPRIVVQPHLLFQGELLSQVAEETTSAAAEHPSREWIIAAHLGPHPLLCQAITERASPAPSHH